MSSRWKTASGNSVIPCGGYSPMMRNGNGNHIVGGNRLGKNVKVEWESQLQASGFSFEISFIIVGSPLVLLHISRHCVRRNHLHPPSPSPLFFEYGNFNKIHENLWSSFSFVHILDLCGEEGKPIAISLSPHS
ncbi:unnamed protein product [Lactuca virosa]|uniref:Uncharacterized protein n=1 Tax=Lactuca virosa TaxID=75947 RepID=A0AAU9NSZ0_9ASTR|nr:unnamed protein product [Lactuca virosa]